MSRHRPRHRRVGTPGRPLCPDTGKVRHGDEATALAVLADHALREKRGQKKQRQDATVYRCRSCGGWHIGRAR